MPSRAQRKGGAAAPTIDDVATATVEAKGGGAPVPDKVRGAAEAQLGADLRGVRVHGDENAQGGAAGMGALAFTHGSDVFLGPGQSADDLRLMTHELAHVVQQGAARRAVAQGKIEVGATDDPAEREADAVADAAVAGNAARGGALVVEDGVEARGAQLTKSALLAQIQDGVEAELAALPPGTADEMRARIAEQIAGERSKSAPEVERSIAQATGVGRAESAQDYVAAARAKVRAQGAASGGVMGAVGAAISSLGFGGGAAQRKPADPAGDVRAELGEGRPLDAEVAGAAGEAYGHSFSNVRIHTDSNAARMAADHDARAFTVGNHVAFGDGEYRPGTPEGDALVAHELAHVAQQGGTEPGVARRQSEGSQHHEQEADAAASGVLARLYGGAKRAVQRVALSATSGFALQRCPRDQNPLQQQAQQLTQELQQLIQNGTWEAIRARMYPLLAQPIRQRADERRTGARPDMTGIASVVSVDTFVQAVHTVQSNWGALNRQTRAQALLAAANAALTAANVQPMAAFTVQQMVPRGSFSPGAWQFNFREQTMDLPSLSNDEAAQVADVTLHEARHAEQHFRVARLLAGQGQTAAQIEASQGIPTAVAQAAAASPLTAANSTAQELAEAQAWDQAMNAQGAQNQQTSDQVLAEIQTLNQRRTDAQTALTALQANATAQTVQDAIAARDALRAQIAAVEAAYRAYRAIAYEADSHETGVTADQAFRRRWP